MKVKATQQRFTDEFKEQSVRQVTERGHKASDVASRLGISYPQPVCVAQALCGQF